MKTNLRDRMEVFSFFLIIVAFWAIMVCGILGKVYLGLWIFLIYTASSIIFSTLMFEKKKGKVVFIMTVMAIGIIPYVIILFIKGLF